MDHPLNQYRLFFDISFSQTNANIIKENGISDLHEYFSKIVQKQKQKHTAEFTHSSLKQKNNCKSKQSSVDSLELYIIPYDLS